VVATEPARTINTKAILQRQIDKAFPRKWRRRDGMQISALGISARTHATESWLAKWTQNGSWVFFSGDCVFADFSGASPVAKPPRLKTAKMQNADHFRFMKG